MFEVWARILPGDALYLRPAESDRYVDCFPSFVDASVYADMLNRALGRRAYYLRGK